MKSLASLSALFLLALPARAQDAPKEGQDPPPPTFEDLRKDLETLKQKGDKENEEKRDREVQKNMEDTLRIYEGVLKGRNGDLENTSKRLGANQALVAKYEKLLDGARTELARLRSSYVNRTLTLRKSLDDGKITPEAYEKLLDEDTRKFRNREKELVDDIAFYQTELETASKLAKDLSVKKELLEFDPFRPEDPSAEPGPEVQRTSLADRLRKKVRDLSGFTRRSVVEVLD